LWVLNIGAQDGVATRGSVNALSSVDARGGVAAQGSVGALGSVSARGAIAAWGGVGALGGVGVRGGVCTLCWCINGVSSSSSLSVKPSMTLRHFQLLSSSSIFKRPPCLGGQWISSSRKAPLMWGASRPPSSSCGVRRLSPPLRCYQSPSVGATNGSIRHPRRPTSHRWERRRCIPLPGPGHGSCIDQIQCYDRKLATIRHGVKLRMTLHIPVAEAKSTFTPSLRLAVGGIPAN
jgi:hypothetical protein